MSSAISFCIVGRGARAQVSRYLRTLETKLLGLRRVWEIAAAEVLRYPKATCILAFSRAAPKATDKSARPHTNAFELARMDSRGRQSPQLRHPKNNFRRFNRGISLSGANYG